MSGTEFGQQFINALSLGSIYALVAIGLAMVFSILRLINFAHGEALMIGAVASVLLAERGLPWPVWAFLGGRHHGLERTAHGAGRLPPAARRP